MDAATVDRSDAGAVTHPSELIGPAYRRYAMTMLLIISIFNYLDRTVVNILAEPIKHDLGLADWQLGMLTGLAFGLLYTFLGLPIARLAERSNRPLIISTATSVWSLFTVACAFVHNFTQLALARVGVGIGEAGCTPPAHSLIMDYAPPEKRGSALAFYGLGSSFGGLVGMAFGGLVADAYGWRTAFLVAGAPGLAFALLAAFTLIEPRKLMARATNTVGASVSAPTMMDTFRYLWSKRSYRFMAVAQILKVFMMIGYAPFLASFYLRNHATELAASAETIGASFGYALGSVGLLGIALGLTNGVAAAIGLWWGGWVADRVGPADPRRYVYIPAIAALVDIPVFAAALLVPDFGWSLVLMGLHGLIAAIWYGPAFAAAFSVSPANMRATNSALLLFLGNLFGLGLGPLLVGLMSDTIGASLGIGDGLRWALVILGMVGFVTAYLFWQSSKTLREEIVS